MSTIQTNSPQTNIGGGGGGGGGFTPGGTSSQILLGNGTAADNVPAGAFDNISAADISSLLYGIIHTGLAGGGKRTFIGNAGSGALTALSPPAGKKWKITGFGGTNPTGGSITTTLTAVFSGVTVPLNLTGTAMGAGAQNPGVFPAHAPILTSSDSIYFTTTGAGLSLWLNYIEFDEDIPLKTVALSSLSVGNNTLYTCPTGKSAVVVAQGTAGYILGTGNGVIAIFNDTGGTRTCYCNIVPNGGSVVAAGSSGSNATNGAASSITSSATTITQFNTTALLTAGDFININTDAATAGQYYWATLVELEASL